MRSVIPDIQPPPSSLSGSDCLTLAEFSHEDIALILDEAIRIKALQKSRIPYRPLRGRTLAIPPVPRDQLSAVAGRGFSACRHDRRPIIPWDD